MIRHMFKCRHYSSHSELQERLGLKPSILSIFCPQSMGQPIGVLNTSCVDVVLNSFHTWRLLITGHSYISDVLYWSLFVPDTGLLSTQRRKRQRRSRRLATCMSGLVDWERGNRKLSSRPNFPYMNIHICLHICIFIYLYFLYIYYIYDNTNVRCLMHDIRRVLRETVFVFFCLSLPPTVAI